MHKSDGIGSPIAPSRKRFPFDQIEPPVVIEDRDHRPDAIWPYDAELAAVDPVDSMGNVDLHLAALEHRLDRMVDYCAFLQAGIGEFGDRHREHCVVLVDGVDMRFDRAIVGDLVSRRLHLRVSRKRDCKELIGIAVFSPALSDSSAAGDKCRNDEYDQTHVGFPRKSCSRRSANLLADIAKRPPHL